MHGSVRRGLFASAWLCSSAFLAAVACSTGEAPSDGEQSLEQGASPRLGRDQVAPEGLLGKATVPLAVSGQRLVPVSSKDAAELGLELPRDARGTLKLMPASKPERSLALTPVLASAVTASLARDGRAVYPRAFGSADLVQSATSEGLSTTIALRDAAAPELFVWKAELGAGLKPLPRDDGGVDLVDSESKIWLKMSPARLNDAQGATIALPLAFDPDGYVRLRVDHRDLAYPAQIDFDAVLGNAQALAVAPTLIKGRVMVLLDTSGSMLWQFGNETETHGDSPRDSRTVVCDNGLGTSFNCTQNVACTEANGGLRYWQVDSSAQPSRMLASKLALQNVVNANAGLLDFGLERYAQATDCANPIYCCNPQINGTTRGLCRDAGDNGGGYADITQTANTDDDISYNGSCGTPTDGGRVLVMPGPTSSTQLLPWVDFVEDFCSSTGAVGGAPRNPELRGDGSTPLARSIITARESWYRPVYNDSRQAGSQPLDDALIDCRPYVLVVMTDGDDTCNAGAREDFDCNGTNANCGSGKCIDADPDDDDVDWRCACTGDVQCTGANQYCTLGAATQDCNDNDAQCGSNDCVDTPGTGDNFRCSCATTADCGTGLICNTTGAPAVDCGGDDARCLSNDCFDNQPGGGTSWRCACTGNAQCPATQQCTGGVCVTRGICQAAGECQTEIEPLPRAQVQSLTSINTTNPVKTYVLGMGNPAALNQTELNAMAVAGGTTQARFASSQAEIEAAFADIVANTVKYEVCNTQDDNCNARIDEGLGVYQECVTAADCAAGATCNAGRCACTAQAQCSTGYTCSAESPVRFCRPSCSEGQGACFVAGVRKCGVATGQCCVDNNSPTCTDITPPAGTPEVCNGIDDNCNGFVDENLPCQGCVPLPEVCDGVDNDCDGAADEVDNPNLPGNDGLVDVGGPCGSSVGRCTPGIAACTGGTLVCNGATGPFPEVCNGYDDDCDGVRDGMTRACYTGPGNTENVGPCRGGTQACTAVADSGTALWGGCVGQQLPTNEVCNGIDDDCDGTIDDGIPAPVGGQETGDECCGDGVSPQQCGVGQCAKGTWKCAGTVVRCDGGGRATNEVCDNADNDCNGETDDITNIGGPCVAPGACSGTLQCNSAEQMLVCVPDGSAGVEVCNGIDDDCDGKTDEEEDISVNDDWYKDPCDEPTAPNDQPPCQAGELICRNGAKVCDGAVGPLPEVCDLKDTDCDGVSDTLAACPGTNACIQGVCVERCRGGEFPCPNGYECRSFEGERYCVPTTCNNVECPPGASCQDGACTLDNAGGAGNEPTAGAGNEPGAGGAADAGAGPGPGDAGESTGGTSATGGSNGTSGNGTANAPSDPESSARYGLVTGGGGCSCRTAPRGGGKWAALSLLLVGATLLRRRGGERRRAA